MKDLKLTPSWTVLNFIYHHMGFLPYEVQLGIQRLP